MRYDEEKNNFYGFSNDSAVGVYEKDGIMQAFVDGYTTADELRFIAQTLDRLNGVDWTDEVPTEEGWYPYKERGESKVVNVAFDKSAFFWYALFHGDMKFEMLEEMPGKWGLKIEFPEVGK